jgi:hypothetical protein
MKRSMALTLATAAAAAAAAVTVAASPGAKPVAGPQALHLVDKQITESGPKGRPGPGSMIVFSGKETGDDSGRSYVHCTLIDSRHGLCLGRFNLSRGTISVETVVPLEGGPKRFSLDITGGTGAYNGARGTATFTDIGKDKTEEIFTLEP